MITADAGSRHNGGLLKDIELVFQSKSTGNHDFHEPVTGEIFGTLTGENFNFVITYIEHFVW